MSEADEQLIALQHTHYDLVVPNAYVRQWVHLQVILIK